MPDLNPETIAIERNSISLEAPSLLARSVAVLLSQRSRLQDLLALVSVSFVVAALSFLTKVKIANALGKADFGLFAYALAIAAYGEVIIDFGLSRTLVRDLIHFSRRQGQLVASSLLLRGVSFLLVTAVLLGWKFLAPAASDLTWGVVLVALGQSMLALELKAVYDSWGRMTRHAVYYLIQRCLYFAAVWLTIILAADRLSIGWLGVFGILAAVFYVVLQGSWALGRIDFGGIEKPILNNTLVLAKANLVVWLSCLGCLSFGVINQILLKLYGGRESLGGYAAGWQIASIGMLFLTQVARVGGPAMARTTKPGVAGKVRAQFLAKYSALMSLIVFPVCLAMIGWPELILRLIYRPEYASSAGALRIMGLYMLTYGLGLVASQYVVSARLEKTYLSSVIIGGVLSVISCMLLIPSMGGTGAALALLLSHGVSMGLYWIALVKHLGDWREGF